MSNKPKKVKTSGVKTITSNDFITAKGLNDLSLKARKMLYIAISQCRIRDAEFYEYRLSVKEFASLMGIEPAGVYQEADNITDELMRGFIRVAVDGQKKFKKYALFTVCEYDHNGEIIFKINPDMSRFIFQLKNNFTQPLLEDFLKMRSSYSIAIWHLMQREMQSAKPYGDNVIYIDLSLEELRNVTGTENKLKKISQFKEKCFDKAISEINEQCGVFITYENVKKGRTIVGFKCKIVSPHYIDINKLSYDTLVRVEHAKQVAAKAKEKRQKFNGNIEFDFSRLI